MKRRGPGRPKGLVNDRMISHRVDKRTADNLVKVAKSMNCSKGKALRTVINNAADKL